MRPIKFRGKRIDNGEWVYGFYYNLCNPISGKPIPVIDESKKFDHDGDSISVFAVIPETVGQFTGLTDKNGREIYEGDWLFVAAGYQCVVSFTDSMFVTVYTHPEDGETIPLCDHFGVYSSNTVEVIGNIHEGGSDEG